MRHHNRNNKLGLERKTRTALTRGLILNLIKKEKIKITEARAKAIRPMIERMVTHAKIDTVAKRRLLATKIFNDQVAIKKLFTEIGPRYKDRNGGYIRITKLPQRIKDSAKMAVIEFV
jgi:large subunit ribosomal protein L17